MGWLKASQDSVVPMPSRDFICQGKKQVGSHETTFHPDVENATVKGVLDLEFHLFVHTNGVLNLAFGMHKWPLRNNLA